MITLGENLIEINLFDNFWELNKKYRENYYRLINLVENYKDICDENLIDEAINAVKKYEEFDNWHRENKDNQEVATTTLDKKFIEVEYNDIFNTLKRAIVENSEICGVQYKILKRLTEKISKANDELGDESEEVSRIILEDRIKRNIKDIKSDSHARDKLDTFKITFKQNKMSTKDKKEINESLKEFNLNDPEYIYDIKDHTYLLEEEIYNFESEQKLITKALAILREEKKIKLNNKKNNLQLIFNIIVGTATIINVCISIMTYMYK